MIRRLLAGAIAGGLVAFAWGAVSWMVLPWHRTTLRSFTNELFVAKTVLQNAPQPGVYLLLPSRWEDSARERQGVPKGLMFFGAVRRESPKMFFYYLRGLGVEMLGALLISWFLLTLPLLDYWARVRVALFMGLGAGFLARLSDWNWWGFSTRFTLFSMLDLVITWTLAGLVIARLVKET